MGEGAALITYHPHLSSLLQGFFCVGGAVSSDQHFPKEN